MTCTLSRMKVPFKSLALGESPGKTCADKEKWKGRNNCLYTFYSELHSITRILVVLGMKLSWFDTQTWPQHTGTLDHFCMLWWKVPKTTKGTNSLCQIIIAVMFGVLKKQRKNLGFGLYICICVCVCVYIYLLYIYINIMKTKIVFFFLMPLSCILVNFWGLRLLLQAYRLHHQQRMQMYIYMCVCVCVLLMCFSIHAHTNVCVSVFEHVCVCAHERLTECELRCSTVILWITCCFTYTSKNNNNKNVSMSAEQEQITIVAICHTAWTLTHALLLLRCGGNMTDCMDSDTYKPTPSCLPC